MLCFGTNTTRTHPSLAAQRERFAQYELEAAGVMDFRAATRPLPWYRRWMELTIGDVCRWIAGVRPAKLAGIVAAVVVAVAIVGCKAKEIDAWLKDHQLTGNALAQSQTLADVTDKQVAKAEKKTKGPTKDILTGAREFLVMLKGKLTEAAGSHEAEAKAHADAIAAKDAEIGKLRGELEHEKQQSLKLARGTAFTAIFLGVVAIFLPWPGCKPLGFAVAAGGGALLAVTMLYTVSLFALKLLAIGSVVIVLACAVVFAVLWARRAIRAEKGFKQTVAGVENVLKYKPMEIAKQFKAAIAAKQDADVQAMVKSVRGLS